MTLVHFTDYHSHAAPFYANSKRGAAGIARAYSYIEPLSRRSDVIVRDAHVPGIGAWASLFGGADPVAIEGDDHGVCLSLVEFAGDGCIAARAPSYRGHDDGQRCG